MSTKIQKIVAAVAATALAASVVLGGTLAWQSINQEATNIVAETINPGGRLHDDFDGENKDIYVENFADVPIYARIQLREYLELGSDLPGTGDLFIPAAAETFHDATVAGNVDNWAIHYFDETKNVTDNYVDFTWGGSTTYMPTFNMNKDSLLPDINGTYEGLYTDGTETVNGTTLEADRYADHVDYSDPQYAVGSTGLSGTEIRDIDTNDIDEYAAAGTGAAGTNWSETSATHYASTTRNATVISMAEWKQLLADGKAGTFYGWVYDTDGWAYWSQPIEPKEVDTTTGEVTSQNTTGLLLNAITPRIDDYYYYQIHVIAQFITANDLGHTDGTGFFAAGKGTEPSADALELLNTIGVDITGGSDLTLSLANNVTSVTPGGSVTFSAADIVGAPVTNATWLVNGSNVVSMFNTAAGTAPATVAETTIKDGTLTVATNEAASELTVIAIAEVETTDNDGNVTSTDTLIGSCDIKVVNVYEVAVSAVNDATELFAGEMLQFSAKVFKNGIENNALGVNWKVEGGSTGTTIDDDGLLTVAAKEVDKAELTITATSQDDSTVFDSYTIIVNKNVYTIAITTTPTAQAADGATTQTFTAVVTENGTPLTNPAVTWSVGSDDTNTTITTDGVLTIAKTEPKDKLVVTATYENETDTVTNTVEVDVTHTYAITVTAEDDATTVAVGGKLQFYATMTRNTEPYTPDSITWSVDARTTGSAIDADAGLLTAGATTGEVTVKATAKGVMGEYKVTLITKQQEITNTAVGGTVDINGTDYWVVVRDTDGDQNRALLWAAAPVAVDGGATAKQVKFGTSNEWGQSSLRATLNGETFMNSLGDIKAHIIQTPISTAREHDRITGYETTNDYVFLLSQADAFGQVWNGTENVDTVDQREYTYGTSKIVEDYMRAWTPGVSGNHRAWLRSPYSYYNGTALLAMNGDLDWYGSFESLNFVRPAFWVQLVS